MTNSTHDLSPPDLTPGYPSKGDRQSVAWADLWKRLSTDTYLDGVELATEVAETHGLARDTLLTLLSNACRYGLLEKQMQSVQGQRGPRPRAHYRVNPNRTVFVPEGGGIPYASAERL